jgi:hypothetical protein
MGRRRRGELATILARARAFEAERAAEHRARQSWGIFPHVEAGKPTGRGFVAREMRDGVPFSNDYRGLEPLKVFRSERLADRYATRLTLASR